MNTGERYRDGKTERWKFGADRDRKCCVRRVSYLFALKIIMNRTQFHSMNDEIS